MTNARSLLRGGVNPPDDRLLSRAAPIGNAALPAIAVIPMLQHAGAPARCLVKPGDLVSEGMLIGRAEGAQCANVHSSIPGRVLEVKEISMPGGLASLAAVIELGGAFERSGRPRGAMEWKGLSRVDLLGKIQAAGIVGLGGRCVPTHQKLMRAPGRRVSLFVASGVDCEPTLSAAHALMRDRAREIVEGMRICQSLLDAARVVLAVGQDAEGLVEEYGRLFAATDLQCDIAVLPSRYPQGNEQLILASLDGSGVLSPTSPESVVLHAGTLYAVYEAVVFDKPLMERVLTVAGTPVAGPRNLKVRLGTPIGELFEECGGLSFDPGKIVVGGPMRGVPVDSPGVPVTKGTTGVVAFTRREARERREWPCINCGSCVDACPWGLVPARLYKLIRQGSVASAAGEGLSRCTECGCCAFACPSHLRLVPMLHSGLRALEDKADA